MIKNFRTNFTRKRLSFNADGRIGYEHEYAGDINYINKALTKEYLLDVLHKREKKILHQTLTSEMYHDVSQKKVHFL